MTKNQTEAGGLTRYLPHILLALILVGVAYVRIRLLQVPLERDEGEYAYMGQLLLKGFAPHLHAYSMKLPGVSMMYALSMAIFGQSAFGVHLGLLVGNGLSALLVYLLAARLIGREAAPAACGSYALLSLSKSVYGVFAHATQFVVLFSLAGFLLLLRPNPKNRLAPLFLSGLCFGLAFIMKQPAALLGLFGLLYQAREGYKSRAWTGKSFLTGVAALIFGMALPYLIVLVWVLQAGSFDEFWFWTVTYAREYAGGLPLDLGLQTLVHNFSIVFAPQRPLYLLAAAGTLVLALRRSHFPQGPVIWGYLLFSFLAVCPGLYFRWHYFILILPGAALLVGVATGYLGEVAARFQGGQWPRHLVPVLLVAAAAGYGFYTERDCFFALTPLEVSYSTYRISPFPAAPEIGAYLKAHTVASDTVAVFGSEPEIYFYSDRLSATGHIYMYSLMEDQPHAERMQRELISQVEAARPKYCVYTRMQFSWLVGPASPPVLLDWLDNYLKKNYVQVGVIEVYDNESQLFWDADALRHIPRPDSNLIVYRLK